MSHVYKPHYTVQIPPGSASCIHRGRPAVRWTGRGGVVRYGVLCPTRPGRCTVEASHWYAVYRDQNGVERRVKGYMDRTATEAMLAKLVQTAERVRSGLLPPEAARPRYTMTEYLHHWHGHLRSEASTGYAALQHGKAVRLITAGEFVRPDQLTPAAVARALARLRDERGLSTATAANYLAAVKGFTRWLCEDERAIETDPLARVSVPTRHEPVREKRALEPAELTRLLDATRTAPPAFGLTGTERACLYLVAASTGLRAQELASLTAASFDLGKREVTIRASAAKNRRADVLPFPSALLRELRPLLRGLEPTERVWPDRTGNRAYVWWRQAADMIAADLERAGIAVRDSAGRAVVFHSLRATYATDLDRAGVSLSRAQKLMRHSSPGLTANMYQKPEKAELAADVEKLKR